MADGGVPGGPDWQGLLKWSLSHSDGTSPPRRLSEDDRKWFMEAMDAQTVDVIRRMKEISTVMNLPHDLLLSQGVTVEDLEGMLEELQMHVESIDMANDLHAIGGLTPLLNYLKNPNASIRARASEVVSTMVQNNPKCQETVLEAKGLEFLLLNFMSDPDSTVRAKSLGAISSLIRNNKPGVSAFRLGNGYVGLKDALASDNLKFQRKGLQVLHYLLHENPSDSSVAVELGFVKPLVSLACADDADIRQAALRSLMEMARSKRLTDTSEEIESMNNLRRALESRVEQIRGMVDQEELGAVKEERALIDSLWEICFHEPSQLRESGLLALPGDDEPPPDVASQLFEPALRAWSAPRPPVGSQNEDITATKPPLLLGG